MEPAGTRVLVPAAEAGHPVVSGSGDLDTLDTEGFAHPHACANCQTPLVGAYCHGCGQLAHVHRTVGALFHDIGHGVFHFEGTLWRTLPLLAWRPGELTRRYVAGERARFVSPMALYLFCVFIMFTVLSLGGHHQAPAATASKPPVTGNAPPARPDPTGAKVSSGMQMRRTGLSGDDIVITFDGNSSFGPAAKQQALDTMHTGSPRLDAAMRRLILDPEFAFYRLKSTAYKYSWVLIPLSLPFMWLLFPFSRTFGVYDHAIFVTYSLSFVTLLFVGLALLIRLGLPEAPLIVVTQALILAHMYRQLRGAYGLTGIGAAWRLVLLLVFVAIVIGLFGLLLAWLGLL